MQAIRERRKSALTTPDTFFNGCAPGLRAAASSSSSSAPLPALFPTPVSPQKDPGAGGVKGEDGEEDPGVLLARMREMVAGVRRRQSSGAEVMIPLPQSERPRIRPEALSDVEIEQAIAPLFDYLDAILPTFNTYLSEATKEMVMTRVWKEILNVIEGLLIPPLSDISSDMKPLSDKEVDIVFKWLKVGVARVCVCVGLTRRSCSSCGTTSTRAAKGPCRSSRSRTRSTATCSRSGSTTTGTRTSPLPPPLLPYPCPTPLTDATGTR